MNICLVLISNGWGGAETVTYELARHLRDKGENVSIILNREILKFYNDLEGIKIFNIGSAYNHKKLIRSIIFPKLNVNGEANLSSFPWSILNEILRPIYFRMIRKQINRFLHANNIDIIHVHTLINSAILVSELNNPKTPAITTIHHPLSFVGKGSINPIQRWKANLYKKTLKKMDKITVVSNFTLRDFEKWIPSLRDKSRIIPNAIPLSEFQKEIVQTLNKEKTGREFTLMFPGGIKPNKGGLILLKAMEILNSKNLPIKLYGAGITTKTFVEENKVENVIFTGFLQHKEYLSKLNNCDCLILLSKTEQFPISIIEAMALEKIIITTPVGGIPEFCLNGRNGLYVKRDPNDVAEKILYLYKNPELRREISKNNRADVKKYDWNIIVDRYIDLYKSLIP